MSIDREPDLVDVVAPAMAMLNDLANAGQALGSIPGAGSLAMAELACEAEVQNPLLGEPVEAAHSVMRIFAFAATDHLRNFARLFASQPVAVYSHLVLARATLDACAVAHWLGEPDIGAERRAQRYQVARLINAKQQRRSPIEESKSKAKEIRNSVEAAAQAANWPLAVRWQSSSSPRVGSEELPAPKEAIATVVGAVSSETGAIDLGALLWWYLSGGHPQLHLCPHAVDRRRASCTHCARAADGCDLH